MVKYLFENNIIIYAYAGLFGLGLVVRILLDAVYKYLVNASDNIQETKNKALKQMKVRFESFYKIEVGVNNVDTFVDKNVLRYRFGGILLSTWENLSGQVLYLVLLIVPVSTVFGVVFDCGQAELLYSGAVGILTGTLLILVDKSIYLYSKKQMIRLNLLDYFENFYKVKLEHPELMEKYRREYVQTQEAGKQVSATTAVKEETKTELNRRREARLKKEEEKKLLALRREEEQKRIEAIRKEEERKRQEERKRIAAKRRQEELLKLQEEQEALEAKRAEAKKKAEEKRLENEKKQKLMLEKENILQSIGEELAVTEKASVANPPVQGMDEAAADQSMLGSNETIEKPAPQKSISPDDEKLFEEFLKEIFG